MKACLVVSMIAAAILPAVASAQGSAPADTAKPANKVTIPIDFSGVVFGNYQYQGAAGPSKGQNKFDVERAYLTFKMPVGSHASIRVTSDLYQQTSSASDAFYKGWLLRAKYAYLQYDFMTARKPGEWGFTGRIGLIHTMFIDHEENFWPRYLSQTPVERAGLFSSADAGIAGIVTLPNKLGEAYLAVTNGSGYASRETDRFKDYQARLTITPLGGSALPYLRTLAIDGWVYRGALASTFVNGGAGQVGPVGSALDRNRYGGFIGIRDPRLVVGVDYAQRQDGADTGANTVASPAGIADSTGRLVAGYIVAKPFKMMDAQSTIPLGIVLRYDQVTPNSSTSPRVKTFIGGLSWDLTKQTTVALDYQEVTPQSGAPVAPVRTYYLHWTAAF